MNGTTDRGWILVIYLPPSVHGGLTSWMDLNLWSIAHITHCIYVKWPVTWFISNFSRNLLRKKNTSYWLQQRESMYNVLFSLQRGKPTQSTHELEAIRTPIMFILIQFISKIESSSYIKLLITRAVAFLDYRVVISNLCFFAHKPAQAI